MAMVHSLLLTCVNNVREIARHFCTLHSTGLEQYPIIIYHHLKVLYTTK